MSFKQNSKPLPQDLYLTQSLKGKYIPYTARPEPVYGQKYENNKCGDNTNYDLEKLYNQDDSPQEIERQKQQQMQRYMDEQSSGNCPSWIGGCFSVFCFCYLLDCCTAPPSLSAMVPVF